jgi:nitroreductase
MDNVMDAKALHDVIYHCRAMRRLKPDPVPEELILQLIDAANQAPSGSNAQGGRWIAVRDRAQKEKLAEINRKRVAWYVASQRERFDSLAHQSPEKRARMVAAVEWQAEHLQDVPVLIFACLELPSGRPETFAAGAGAAGSIWPGVQNLLLTARALGLGAAPTTLGIIDRAEVKAVLGLPEHIDPFCLIPVGYPSGNFGAVTRRPASEIMRWDRWE